MIKLVYFDFNFWRVDILRLCLSYANIPYTYDRLPRADWPRQKQKFPFGQLPIMIYDNKQFGHTHSLAVFCAKKASLYEKDELKILVINQVIDWANEITNKIAPSIRAEMRDKNFEKSKKLRKLFIKNDLPVWFSYLENLLKNFSSDNNFFTDKFSIADITAWRVIYWFYSGKLDQINSSFIDEYPILKKYFLDISAHKKFSNLDEFKQITQEN